MNFLNKKYVSSTYSNHTNPINSTNSYQLHNSHSKSFLPPSNIPTNLSQTVRQPGHQHIAAIGVNNCQIHDNQLIRHICLECNQLLCSQCISEHIDTHRQNNTFPKIQTIKNVRQDMNKKLQGIYFFMNQQNKGYLEVDTIRRRALQKIELMKKEVVKTFEEWAQILKNHLLQTIGFDQIISLQSQMQKLQQQVLMLKNALNTNSSVSVVKKVFQIDSDKLQDGYKSMNRKYSQLLNKANFSFQIDWDGLVKNFQTFIKINNSIREDIDLRSERQTDNIQLQSIIQTPKNKQYDLPLNTKAKQPLNNITPIKVVQDQQKKINQIAEYFPDSSELSLLHLLTPGDQPTLSIFTVKQKSFISTQSLRIPFPVSPLSASIVNGDMLFVSGGIVNENKKNDQIIIYDFREEKIIFQDKLKYPRSSHSMILNENQLFIVGGFQQSGDCLHIQILNTQVGLTKKEDLLVWGGSCVTTLLQKDKILKVSIQGAQIIDLANFKSKQLKLSQNVDFKKGMKLCKLDQEHALLFGNDSCNYIINTSSGQVSITTNSVLLQGVLDSFYSAANHGILTLTFSKNVYLYENSKGNWKQVN